MSKTILMCAPTYFDIEYEINPWMSQNNQVDQKKAYEQWTLLHEIYAKKMNFNVQLIDPIKNLPDMVFTANGALVINDKVALPTFREPDRQGETDEFKEWFRSKGKTDFLKTKYDFEGEGDALVWNDIIFAGYPWRTDRAAHQELASYFNMDVISLQLADARFYHLDTCLTIVDNQTVAIWQDAFTKESIRLIHEQVPKVIMAMPQDAFAYGLNAMSDGNTIVMPEGATNLTEKFKEIGKNVITTPIGEFQKSGGGVKCLTLELR
jgi:N-dimethylarginine dimethylaminohydrolase